MEGVDGETEYTHMTIYTSGQRSKTRFLCALQNKIFLGEQRRDIDLLSNLLNVIERTQHFLSILSESVVTLHLTILLKSHFIGGN